MNLNKDIKEIKEWFKEELILRPEVKVNKFIITYALKDESDKFLREFKNINQVIAWRVVMDKLITWYCIGTE